jgi:hypothetical protein
MIPPQKKGCNYSEEVAKYTKGGMARCKIEMTGDVVKKSCEETLFLCVVYSSEDG